LINADENTDMELPLKIFSHNSTIPIILTTEKDSIISITNLDDEILADTLAAKAALLALKRDNEPIIIEYVPGSFRYLYYGNSTLLNKLKYYPIALVMIIVLFGGVVYNFYRSTKMATQN